MKIRYLMVFGTAVCAFAQNTPQAPVDSGAIIRTEARQVLVDSVVTDKKGEYVRDLQTKDFKVWEDGKEQTIKSFSYEADPLAPNHGRTHYLVLFFDNSSMDMGDQVRARQAAAKFIDANAGPDRQMAIVNYGGTLQVAQNFTGSVERLKAAANGVAFASVNPNETPGSPRLSAAADFAARDMLLALRSLAKNLAFVPGRKSLVLLTAGFKMTAEQISEITATIDACNKANVAVYPIDVRGLATGAPGLAWNEPSNPMRPYPGLSSYLRPAFFVPQRGGGAPGGGAGAGAGGGGGGAAAGGGGRSGGGAPGGAVGGGNIGGAGASRGTGGFGSNNPGGRSAPGNVGNAGGRGNAPNAPGPGATGRGAGSPMIPGLNPYNQSRDLIPKIPDSVTDNQNVMFMLADGTGGFVIRDTNDLLGGMQKIGQEQDQYYLIGYTPPVSPEGSCHVLKVKVDRGGVTVRSRTGYCNAKPQDLLSGNPIEKQLETRASAPQAGGIAANMQLPFFFTSANVARVNVAMEIASQQIKFEKVKGKQHGEVNVLGIAYTAGGAVAARFSDTVRLDFEEKKEVENFQKNPLHYENQFDIGSGKYNLKVVFSSGGESFGKLEMPLAVDSYAPDQFTMSGLALSKEARNAANMGSALDASLLEDKVPLMVGNLQVVPSGTNEFKKGEPALFYVEIYEPELMKPPDPQTPLALAIQMRVLDRKTGEQKEDTGLMRLTDIPKPGSPVIALGEKMPVDKLTPGSYRLELSALDTANNQFKRTVDFELR